MTMNGIANVAKWGLSLERDFGIRAGTWREDGP